MPTIEIPGLGNILSISLLSDGKTLALTLLGLPISVFLLKSENPDETDTAVIKLGDSTISLPCHKPTSINDGSINSNDAENSDETNVEIHLLKGNASYITDSTVTGIAIGYDVYGGGTSYSSDGSGDENPNGYAGGFVGYNREGRMLRDKMIYCDVVKGSNGKVGHFNGTTILDSEYGHTASELERNDEYSVYREVSEVNEDGQEVNFTDYTYALTSSNAVIDDQPVKDTPTGQSPEKVITYNRYDIVHRAFPVEEYADWENAVMAEDASGSKKKRLLRNL